MWARLINAALGVWLMAAPAVLSYGDPAETNDRIVGPLIASVAVIAIWQVTRPLRWVNLVLGAWLVVAPWVLGYAEGEPMLNSPLVGALVIAMSLVRGPIRVRDGGGWSSLWRDDELAEARPRERVHGSAE